jgi:malonyl-CoA O-methyltransferase
VTEANRTSPAPWGEGIRKAFDRAAETYGRAAVVQRTVALRLAEKIATLPLPPRPRILEIGCGTGFLTQALRERLPDAEWLVTDISPRMLDACRVRIGTGGAEFRVMDGERPALEGGRFDLVCSSLAVQWFEDLGPALEQLAGLAAPGGWLAFSTLAEGTLEDWRRAHADLGLVCGGPDYPGAAALAAMLGPRGRIETETVVQAHSDARAFLGDLKAIGAASPIPGRRPLAPGDLKRVMQRFDAAGASARYEIAYGFRRQTQAPARGVFVTGTDTGVGKTLVSAWLVKAWGADYFKPVQTGLAEEAGDTATVAALAGAEPERLHPPVHAFDPPVSPHLAAEQAGVEIRLDDFRLPESRRAIVVEGAGGALVPLNGQHTMLDLMVRLDLPVVVVVADRLGAINQTLLTLQALRARGLEVLGVVLTGHPFADNRAAIERHGAVRILAELPFSDRIDAAQVAAWAERAPPLEELRPELSTPPRLCR